MVKKTPVTGVAIPKFHSFNGYKALYITIKWHILNYWVLKTKSYKNYSSRCENKDGDWKILKNHKRLLFKNINYATLDMLIPRGNLMMTKKSWTCDS